MKNFVKRRLIENHRRPEIPKGTEVEVLAEDDDPIIYRYEMEPPHVLVFIEDGALSEVIEIGTGYIDLKNESNGNVNQRA